jgi:hypothetical protein
MIALARYWSAHFGFPTEEIMIRRQLLSKLPQLFGLGLLGLRSAKAQVAGPHKPLKIMMKSAGGRMTRSGVFPVCARAGVVRRGSRGADFPHW